MLLAALAGGASGLAVYSLTAGVIGPDALELSIIITAVVGYMGLSFPKRMLDSAALTQSREAPALAAMGSANVDATSSRTRALLLLRSGEPEISSVLRDLRAKALLGYQPLTAFQEVEGRLASYSARSVIRSIVAPMAGTIVEGGEESQGIAQSSALAEDSKLPLFTAVAFFTPMMLLFYAILSHLRDLASFVELVALQVVLLDVAFHFTSTERRRLG